jgi:hypothetical protein
VENIVQSLKGQPWKLINTDALLEEVESQPYVDHATYDTNVFGRSELHIFYRTPVARLAGHPDVYIDRIGQVFQLKAYTKPLPSLTVASNVLEPSGCITTGYDLVDTGKVAQMLTDRLPNYAWKVELDPRSVLFLQLEKGVHVVLGPPENLEAKIDKLSEILTKQAELWNVREINLSVPNQPVYTP